MKRTGLHFAKTASKQRKMGSGLPKLTMKRDDKPIEFLAFIN